MPQSRISSQTRKNCSQPPKRRMRRLGNSTVSGPCLPSFRIILAYTRHQDTIIHTQKLHNHWEQKYRSLSENLNGEYAVYNVTQILIAIQEQRKNDLVKFIHLSGQHLLSQALEGNSHETLRQAVKKSVEELTATSVRYHPGGLNFEEIETVLSSTPDKRLSLSKRQRTDGDSEIPASKRHASKCLTKDSLPSGSRPKVQQSGDKSVNKT